MGITGVTAAQNIYQYSKIAKYTPENVSTVSKTSDTVEISAEAIREAKISSFLKDKPYSTYKYEWMQRNRPEEASSFIDTVMKEYDLDRYVISSTYPYYPKERDGYATGIFGYQTADDVKKGMEEGNLALGAQNMMFYLSNLEETKNTLYDDGKDLQLDYDVDWPKSGAYLNAYKEDFSFYKEMKVDPETAEVWFLPKDSDEWVPKSEFEKKYPDYKASKNVRQEFFVARDTGHDTAIKYIENYIAGLSEEDKAYIKDLNLLNSPAFRNLGIEGLEQFTTSYEETGNSRPFMSGAYHEWVVNNGKASDQYEIPFNIRAKYATDTSLTTEEAVEKMKQEWTDYHKSRLRTNENSKLPFVDESVKYIELFTLDKRTFEERANSEEAKSLGKIFSSLQSGNYNKDIMTLSLLKGDAVIKNPVQFAPVDEKS